MRRPKGIKTKKSVTKRFKITGTGKVMFRGAGKRHLMQGKSSKRRRSLRKASILGPTDVYRIKQNLPFSHEASGVHGSLPHGAFYFRSFGKIRLLSVPAELPAKE